MALSVGARLGRYEILALAGAGGMGEVYKARDTPTGVSGYDVFPDGRRFLRPQQLEPEQAATQINVVINWFEDVKRRVPAK